MDDETIQRDDEFQSKDSAEFPEQLSFQPEKPKRSVKFYVGIVAATVCACLTIGGAIVALGLNEVSEEKAPVEAVLDDFMREMLAEDVDAALELFSPRAQRQFSKSDLDALLAGNNYILFEGYQSLTVGRLNIKAVANTNPDVAQGTVAEVIGTITYENDFSGNFVATLEKVDGEWFLFFINITVPPDKLP